MNRSEPDLLLLLGLRLRNPIEVEALADSWQLDPAETGARMATMAEQGLVRRRDEPVAGWTLTPEGRAEGARLLADELDRTGTRTAVSDGYERFLHLNGEFLTVCSRWQVKDRDADVLNTHDDPAYDAAVVGELSALDQRVQPICSDLTAALERFGGFGPRFSAALERVHAGENDWFARPLIDSYHTVWFDLHETLLASLGIDRATEATS